MTAYGVSIASERQTRVEATELVGDQVRGGLVPLVIPCKDTKGEKAHIPHLWGAIKSNLDQNEDESRGYVNNKNEILIPPFSA